MAGLGAFLYLAASIGAGSIDVYSDDEITEILASIERIPCCKKDKIQF